MENIEFVIIYLVGEEGWRRFHEVRVACCDYDDLSKEMRDVIITYPQNIEDVEYKISNYQFILKNILDEEDTSLFQEPWEQISWDQIQDMTVHSHCVTMFL